MSLIPTQITFRGLEPSEALESYVRERAEQLERFYSGIVHCHVLVELPHRHAEHGRRTLIPPNTYSQIHARPADASLEALSAALSVPLDTRDGIAECLFPDLAAFHTQMARAEVAVDALEDEKNFIDHARSTFGLFRVD